MYCKACRRETIWKAGIALVNTPVVHGDFPGDFSGSYKEAVEKGIDVRGQTMSMSGPPKMVKVTKCTKCGRSVG